MRLLLRPATIWDVPAVLNLIDEAAAWLQTKNTDQWSRPWPNDELRRKRIEDDVRRKETWLVLETDQAIGTITLGSDAAPFQRDGEAVHLWTTAERVERAIYLRRLVIHRDYARQGLGAELLDWAGSMAAQHGCRWIRIDVWTTNKPLHDYYKRQGFAHVRTRTFEEYPSGALFQREARFQPTPRFFGLNGASSRR